MLRVHVSVGAPAASEWPSALSVVQTASCLGSCPQTLCVPSGAESLFYRLIATDRLDGEYPAELQQRRSQGD